MHGEKPSNKSLVKIQFPVLKSNSENFLGELRGAPLKALADLLNHLAQRGYSLNVGAYVSTGATTAADFVKSHSFGGSGIC